MSAAPIGNPGCPDFACSTASIASARMAFAMRSCSPRGNVVVRASDPPIDDDAAAAVAGARGDIRGLIVGEGVIGRASSTGGTGVNETAHRAARHAQNRTEQGRKAV